MQLHVPGAPASLVQGWVQTAYDELCGNRHWAWLRRTAILTTLASRTVTPTFTQGSAAITSVGEFVVATDPGRQIRVTGGPIYTIDTVASVNAATLTQAYAGTGGALAATIQDIYIPMPANFRSIFTVVDQAQQRPIAWWVTPDQLNAADPARIGTGSAFRVLVGAEISQVTSLLGRVTYEAWPYATAAGSYILRYFIRTDTLADDDIFQGVLATQTRVLELGARAEAAMWPGTLEKRNPYFNLPLATKLRDKFDEAAKALDIQDDDQYLMDLLPVDLHSWGLSGDTSLLRQSDATLADYY